MASKDMQAISKAIELHDHLCVLRSFCHWETSHTTHQDWVPSLNLGYNVKISDSGERCARAKKRCDRKKASVVVNGVSDYSEDEQGKEVQTAVTHSDITALKEDLRQLIIMKDEVDKEVGCLQEEQLSPALPCNHNGPS